MQAPTSTPDYYFDLDYNSTVDYSFLTALACTPWPNVFQGRLLWFFIMLIALVVAGTGLVLCVLCQFYRNAKALDVFLACLCFTGLLLIPSLTLRITFSDEGSLKTWVCQTLACLTDITGFLIMWIMCCISVWRMLLLCYPRHTYCHRPIVAVKVFVVLSMLSVCFALPPALMLQVRWGHAGTVCYVTWGYETLRLRLLNTYHLCAVSIPAVIMVVCYATVCIRVMSTRLSKKLKVVRTIMVLMLAFLILYIPEHALNFIDSLFKWKILPYNCFAIRVVWACLEIARHMQLLFSALVPWLLGCAGSVYKARIYNIWLKTKRSLSSTWDKSP